MAKRPPKPVPAKDMIPVVGGHLQRLGFLLTHRSGTGSRYFRMPHGPFELRISDHPWPRLTSQLTHPQVVLSVVLQPMPAAALPDLALEIALGFLVAEVARHRTR